MTHLRPPTRRHSDRTFGLRLIALVVAVNVFAIMLAGSALLQSHRNHRKSVETISQNLAQVLEQNISATIERIDGALHAVIDEIERQDRAGIADEAALNALLTRYAKRTPGIVGLRTADTGGRVNRIVGGDTSRPPQVSDRDYFVRLRDDSGAGLVISEPIFGRISNKWIVVVGRRFNHADGSFAGIVFAPVPLENLSRTFGRLDLGRHGAVALRNASLAVIARYPEILDGGTSAIGNKEVSPILREMVQQSPAGGTYYAQTAIDGIERTLSYRKLADYPLYIIVGLAADDYLQGWREELVRALALFGLFTPLTIAAALWVLRSWRDEEHALKHASEMSARLHAILGNTPIGLAIIDHERRIIEANDALAEIFGVDPASLPGSPTQVLYPSAAEFEALGGRAYPAICNGGTFSDTITMRSREGRTFWCKLTGRLVDAATPDLGYVWVFEDISEQIAATEALRASEERFRALVDGVRDYAIILLDPNGTVQTWNSGAEAIKGYNADEIVGQSFRKFYCDEDIAAGQPERALSQARLSGRVEAEGWRLRKDGSRFWASIVLTALHADDGSVRGFAKITRDITQRRETEAEIKRLVSYQQAILTNTPVGIAILDLKRTIIRANDAFCRIYGREGEQLAGRPASILYGDPRQSQDVEQRAYPLVIAGGTFSDDVLMCRRDGTHIWVRLIAHLVDESQPELGVVWAAEDISALKELNESLMRSNADLERFAYVASHDLRQPLRMISSYIGLIERRLRDRMDDELREFLGYAIDGAQRMDRMIVDMLDYSRIGRHAIDEQEVSLANALRRALDNLNGAIAEGCAEIEVTDPLPVVVGSASELERLFQNLIGNAIKFRAPDRPPHVAVRCSDQISEWIISVADNGIGIDPANHGRLFTLFSRLVSQQQYEGTGIGLAACRKIVEHHGGRIWVESPPDGGTIFLVALPKRKS